MLYPYLVFALAPAAHALTFLGCYPTGALPGSGQPVASMNTFASPAVCGQKCSSGSGEAAYVGVSYSGAQCWCSDKAPEDDKTAKDDKCAVECPGYSLDTCGDSKGEYWSVYAEKASARDDDDDDDDGDGSDTSTSSSKTSGSSVSSTAASGAASSTSAATTASASATPASASESASASANISATAAEASVSASPATDDRSSGADIKVVVSVAVAGIASVVSFTFLFAGF